MNLTWIVIGYGICLLIGYVVGHGRGVMFMLSRLRDSKVTYGVGADSAFWFGLECDLYPGSRFMQIEPVTMKWSLPDSAELTALLQGAKKHQAEQCAPDEERPQWACDCDWGQCLTSTEPVEGDEPPELEDDWAYVYIESPHRYGEHVIHAYTCPRHTKHLIAALAGRKRPVVDGKDQAESATP